MTTRIDWSGFWPASRSDLPDGDIVILTITRNTGIAGVQVSLNCSEIVTWWKGLRLVDAQGQPIGPDITAENADGGHDHTYSLAQVQSAARLELWKAKFLGVHTPIYDLVGLASELLPGSILEFHWVQDSGHVRHAQLTSAIFGGVQQQDNQAMTVQVAAGAHFTLETRVVNPDSTVAFDPALDFILGSQDPQDNATWGNNRWALPGRVLSGQGLNVVLHMTAPAQGGVYPLSIRMVQDGVEWFGDTLTFSATVTGSATPPPAPPGTCIVTALTVALGLLGAPQQQLLDSARQVRGQLLQSDDGARLVALYYEVGSSPEVRALLRHDRALQWQCLGLARALAAQAGAPAKRSATTDGAWRLPVALHRRVDAVLARVSDRSSPSTSSHLNEIRRLLERLVQA